MDYKYIMQLLQRYWNCETTVSEERILRDFFQQEEIPESLRKYAPLFRYEEEEQKVSLGDDFDERMLSRINETIVKARRNTIHYRLRPFYKAAAVVAIVFTLGMAAQHSFSTDDAPQQASYNYATYKDTYTDPQVAYEQVSSALKTVGSGLREAGLEANDSTSQTDANVNTEE